MAMAYEFKEYSPKVRLAPNVRHIRAGKTGRDWYELVPTFSDDTMKIVYDENGLIRDFNKNAQNLWPENLFLAEVPLDAVPDALINDEPGARLGFTYKDGVIAPVPVDYVKKAQKERAALLLTAETEISALTRLVKYAMASDEQKALLEAWEKYSLKIYAIDPATATGSIDWPLFTGE